MKKAMIAMSGGVDSSVAAWLMKRDGYDCMGVTMRLFAGEDSCERKGHTCCSLVTWRTQEALHVSWAFHISCSILRKISAHRSWNALSVPMKTDLPRIRVSTVTVI